MIDVWVVGACPPASVVGGAPTDALLSESFAFAATPTPLGTVQLGHAGVYARVRSTTGACAVRAAGCTEVAMLDTTTVVDVSLVACTGAACPGAPSSPTCAGASDAGGTCPDGAAPQAEVCDGVDNDCNGQTDDDLGRDCAVDSCTPGVQTCVHGAWTVCVEKERAACATPPRGTCGSSAVPTVMLMRSAGTMMLTGSTCSAGGAPGASDHFAIGNHAPCTPDAVYLLQFGDATGADVRYDFASDLPLALVSGCDGSSQPSTCGTTLADVFDPAARTSTLVIEASDGGCGPFNVTITPH